MSDRAATMLAMGLEEDVRRRAGHSLAQWLETGRAVNDISQAVSCRIVEPVWIFGIGFEIICRFHEHSLRP